MKAPVAMDEKPVNHYARLGLPLDATPDEVRHAYRDMARRFHPDTRPDEGHTHLFLNIQQAYETLSDPVRRAAYDESLPADAKRPPAIAVSTLYSRSALARIAETQLIYVLLELIAQPNADTISSPPLNVCLVLDCSTSMQGGYMDTVKATAIELLRELRPQDVLSVVTFADRAETLVPASTNLDHAQIETSIRMLKTGGGTEILQGLEAGHNEVRRYKSRNSINHVLLVTDGRTYGDETQCLKVAQSMAQQGIGVSGLGIGSKWNDDFLDNLASVTGGSSFYVSRPRDIHRFLKEKFSGLGQSYAENLIYHFTMDENVELRYAFRMQPEAAPLENVAPIHLGNLQRNASMGILFEFAVKSTPPNVSHIALAEGRLTLDIPTRATASTSMRLRLSRATSSDPDPEAPPPSIVQAMSRLTLYRMQERARQDVAEGQIREATRRLQNIATHLLAQGNRELARAVLSEANHVQRNNAFSDEGDKMIKYGTRGLLLPASIKDRPS